jgi:hypothetical protein
MGNIIFEFFNDKINIRVEKNDFARNKYSIYYTHPSSVRYKKIDKTFRKSNQAINYVNKIINSVKSETFSIKP